MSDATSISPLCRTISVRIPPILFCCYLINSLDRVNVSFAQLPIATALGIGPAAYGVGAGFLFAAILPGYSSSLEIKRHPETKS